MDKRKAAKLLRELAKDPGALYVAHLAIEDELVDRRDRGIGTTNRNGLVIFSRDSQPSPVIRMGVQDAVTMALNAMADSIEKG